MSGRQNKFQIAFATTARSEYFQMRPLIRALQNEPGFEVILLVGGAHLSKEHGLTIKLIERDGMPVAARLETLMEGDTIRAVAGSAARTVSAFAESLVDLTPDLLFIFGDRYEHLAVALAARCLDIPVAHVHGGEVTFGASDERYRHAISKLADLHFVSTEVYAARLRQMGEAPDRIVVSGAPFVDLCAEIEVLTRDALERALERTLPAPLALVVYHPATASEEAPGIVIKTILDSALAYCNSLVISNPNHDTGYQAIEDAARMFAAREPKASYRGSLGDCLFHSLMHHADLMIGNSSAGLHEAAYHRLPVVDVGTRQQGRLAARHVIRSTVNTKEIGAAIRKALHPNFRNALPQRPSPFGDVKAAKRIVAALRAHKSALHKRMAKPFIDLEEVNAATLAWNLIHA